LGPIGELFLTSVALKIEMCSSFLSLVRSLTLQNVRKTRTPTQNHAYGELISKRLLYYMALTIFAREEKGDT
jgi:hypothetical protein